METPRITGGFSLASRLGNALALSLQSRGLKTKNLLKQAWQIFLCSSLVVPGRFIVETPRITVGFSLTSRLGNAVCCAFSPVV